MDRPTASFFVVPYSCGTMSIAASSRTGRADLDEHVPQRALVLIERLEELGATCVAFGTFEQSTRTALLHGFVQKLRDLLVSRNPVVVTSAEHCKGI
jgi:hypothetical protein